LNSGDPADISRILHTARRNNLHLGVTSLLIFDGATFCHYLEGEHSTLIPLLGRIATDTRHTSMLVRSEGPLDSRRFPEQPIAFALTGSNDALECFDVDDGRSAFDQFEMLLPSLDMGHLTDT
jgi:hypothetical protein